jgi:hypothetical protein
MPSEVVSLVDDDSKDTDKSSSSVAEQKPEANDHTDKSNSSVTAPAQPEAETQLSTANSA